MNWSQAVLTLLLTLSVGANVFQYHKWHTYRTRSAGTHSHTGLLTRITPEMLEADRKKNRG